MKRSRSRCSGSPSRRDWDTASTMEATSATVKVPDLAFSFLFSAAERSGRCATMNRSASSSGKSWIGFFLTPRVSAATRALAANSASATD